MDHVWIMFHHVPQCAPSSGPISTPVAWGWPEEKFEEGFDLPRCSPAIAPGSSKVNGTVLRPLGVPCEWNGIVNCFPCFLLYVGVAGQQKFQALESSEIGIPWGLTLRGMMRTCYHSHCGHCSVALQPQKKSIPKRSRKAPCQQPCMVFSLECLERNKG